MTDTAIASIAPIRRAIAVAGEAGDLPALQSIHAELEGLRRYALRRGVNTEKENEIAEAILRDEREMGLAILRMRDDGLIQPRGGQRGQGVDLLPPVAEVLPGVHKQYIAWWQGLARIPEDKFEQLLVTARMANERISKVDFYKRSPRVDQREHAKAQENDRRADPALAMLKQAVNAIVGWTVAENGEGYATENRLLAWPADHLIEMAELVQRLAEAYRKARAARQ